MNYWIGINSSVSHKNKVTVGAESFWCLPTAGTAVGDLLFLYLPRSASSVQHGLHAKCKVVELPDPGNSANYRCRYYKYKGGRLAYT